MTAGFDYTRWDVLDAHYWWAVHHHTGQWSPEYARIGKIHNMGYRPGRLANGPDTEAAQMIYDALCARIGCDCVQDWHEQGGETE